MFWKIWTLLWICNSLGTLPLTVDSDLGISANHLLSDVISSTRNFCQVPQDSLFYSMHHDLSQIKKHP